MVLKVQVDCTQQGSVVKKLDTSHTKILSISGVVLTCTAKVNACTLHDEPEGHHITLAIVQITDHYSYTFPFLIVSACCGPCP
jgi:hypothetical protein